MRDNLEKFTEMCEDMERRHRQELQQLRESYEGRQLCYMLILVFLLVLCFRDSSNSIDTRKMNK